MSKTKHLPARQGTGRTGARFSAGECAEIAAEFDGTTPGIDRLMAKWSALKHGLGRNDIVRAARRGGYTTAKARQGWSESHDQFLRENWHRMSGDEVAAALGRTFNSVNLRRKRLGIGRYEGEDLTIRDLETLTRLDHRQWQEFIERGWLRARRRERRNEASPITYVSLDALQQLLQSHPEVYDYQGASRTTRALLELGRLEPAPAWKRVVCRSMAWQDKVKATPMGRQVTHGAATLGWRKDDLIDAT